MTVLKADLKRVSIMRPLLVFLVVLPPSIAGFLAGSPWAVIALVALSVSASVLWQALTRFAHMRRLDIPLPCTFDDGMIVDLPSRLRGPIRLVLRCVEESNGSGAVSRSVLYDEEAEVAEPAPVRLRVPDQRPGQWELDVHAAGFAARYPVPHLRATTQPNNAPAT